MKQRHYAITAPCCFAFTQHGTHYKPPFSTLLYLLPPPHSSIFSLLHIPLSSPFSTLLYLLPPPHSSIFSLLHTPLSSPFSTLLYLLPPPHSSIFSLLHIPLSSPSSTLLYLLPSPLLPPPLLPPHSSTFSLTNEATVSPIIGNSIGVGQTQPCLHHPHRVHTGHYNHACIEDTGMVIVGRGQM